MAKEDCNSPNKESTNTTKNSKQAPMNNSSADPAPGAPAAGGLEKVARSLAGTATGFWGLYAKAGGNRRSVQGNPAWRRGTGLSSSSLSKSFN